MAGGLYFTQLVKRVLGIPLYEPDKEWVEEWTAADQMIFFAGERVDIHQGLWKRTGWDGVESGRGLSQEQQWRNGSSGAGSGNPWNR